MSFDQLGMFDVAPDAPDPRREHEAQWSWPVLEAIAARLARGVRVHDCFAGTGDRLGQMADRKQWVFTGTDLQAVFIFDPRVVQGDATDPDTYPTEKHYLLTSPVYPNGMADDFKARDPEGRHTYRAAQHRLLGHDEPLHPNNMGRYGYRPGRPPENKAIYWGIAEAAVACWTAATVFVNVKDFIHSNDVVEPVVEPWAELLEHHGYLIVERVKVPVPGQRHGANRHRVDHEVVLVAPREGTP